MPREDLRLQVNVIFCQLTPTQFDTLEQLSTHSCMLSMLSKLPMLYCEELRYTVLHSTVKSL